MTTDTTTEITEGDWKTLATTEITHLTDEEKDYLPRAWDEWIARVRRDAQRAAAQMIRDACDRWEVDGDDERLVNDVLDPWTSRVLNPEEAP